jgi:hypothetical protein
MHTRAKPKSGTRRDNGADGSGSVEHAVRSIKLLTKVADIAPRFAGRSIRSIASYRFQ